MSETQIATLSLTVLLDNGNIVQIATASNLDNIAFWRNVLHRLEIQQQVDAEIARLKDAPEIVEDNVTDHLDNEETQ